MMITHTPSHIALDKLKSGNRRYVAGESLRASDYVQRRSNADRGQDPFAAILSCADSRVVPELIFDQRIGDLFVARVAGNVANSASIASLEFAVTVLSTRLIVVLGHEECGAVEAAGTRTAPGTHLDRLLERVRASLHECSDGPIAAARCNAAHSAARLIADSPILAGTRDLVVVPAFYWLTTGKVSWINDEA